MTKDERLMMHDPFLLVGFNRPGCR